MANLSYQCSFLQIGSASVRKIADCLSLRELLALAFTCKTVNNDCKNNTNNCERVTQIDWLLRYYPNIARALLNNERFIIRQYINLSPKFHSTGLGYQEEKGTRTERKFVHKLIAKLGGVSKTVKDFTTTTEEVDISCGCCPCCCECFEFPPEDFPRMGILLNEHGYLKKYLVFEPNADYYICIGPSAPCGRPTKIKKAVGSVTSPVRKALFNKRKLPFKVFCLD
tara:strand:- start:114 stop:788 length:675 start_codon:yes stop_codon:yes gene_type:complete